MNMILRILCLIRLMLDACFFDDLSRCKDFIPSSWRLFAVVVGILLVVLLATGDW
jgi:hypothetical protein